MLPGVDDVLFDVLNFQDGLYGHSSRLHGSTLQNSDRMDLLVVRAAQTSDSSKSVTYAYAIPGPENPLAPSCELFLAGYYVLDLQAMCHNIHVHSPTPIPSSIKISGGTTAQVHAVQESILADGEGISVSMRIFSLDAYTNGEILAFIGQLVCWIHMLCDIKKQHRNLVFARFDPVATNVRGR